MNKITKQHFASLYPQFEQKNGFEVKKYKDEAVSLIENTRFYPFNHRHAGITSWNYENRFSKTVNKTGDVIMPLTNKDSYGYMSINRDFEPQNDGWLTLITEVILTSAENGARIYLTSEDKNVVFEIFTRDGFFLCKTDKEYKTDVAVKDGLLLLKAELDLDKKCVLVAINGVVAGSYKLGDFTEVSKIFLSTTPGYENLTINTRRLYLQKNFYVDEIFPCQVYPYDWEKSEAYPVPSKGDRYVTCALKFDKNTTARKNFKTVDGKLVLEHYFYMPNMEDVCTVHFSDALTVKVTGNTISAKELCHSFKNTVWQCIHVETDTEREEAAVFINGKKRAVVKLDGNDFSYISFEFEKNSSDGYLLIDDVRVYRICDYEDYCPKPQKAASPDYNLIMSVCSLWREGGHFGWDCISPFDECTPLMGYYDEGIPEAADWETKFMVEHGVTALQYCWYAPFNSQEFEPIKRPAGDWQQHYGYFYGKYSDMLKFCFMWENAGFKDLKLTLEEFRTYIWDYWVEWYFRDSRYLTVDNKPVVHIYIINYFISTFGGIEEAKKVIDFMREDIKNYGFDGIVLLVNKQQTAKADWFDNANYLGFDGVCKYCWSQGAYDADYIKNQNEKLLNDIHKFNKDMFLVPTVCTGWNIIGWKDYRSPLMDKAEHKRLLEYYKEIIDNQKGNYGLLYMSTWNEYGEGHWLAPSGLNGFDYADAWREVFTNEKCEHTDITPTLNQMSRICHLYNDKRTPIRPWHQEVPPVSSEDMEVVASFATSDKDWNFEQCDVLEKSDKAIRIKSTGNDAKIILKRDINIPFDDFEYIHLRLKTSVYEDLVIFYCNQNEESLAFSGLNKLTGSVYVTGEYVDYYFDVVDIKNQTFKNIRIDPSNSADVETEISAIEFVKRKKNVNDFEVVVDGEHLEIPYYYKKYDGEYYLAVKIENGFFSASNIYYEWNRFENRLYLKTSTDTEFVFHVGSDVCLVNGKEEKLDKPFYLFDKLPVIPLKFLFDKAGIKVDVQDNIVSINVRGK